MPRPAQRLGVTHGDGTTSLPAHRGSPVADRTAAAGTPWLFVCLQLDLPSLPVRVRLYVRRTPDTNKFTKLM
jgi:hypothetical protein